MTVGVACRTQQASKQQSRQHLSAKKCPGSAAVCSEERAGRKKKTLGRLWTLKSGSLPWSCCQRGRLVDAWGRAWAATVLDSGHWTRHIFLAVRAGRAAQSVAAILAAAGKFYQTDELEMAILALLLFLQCCRLGRTRFRRPQWQAAAVWCGTAGAATLESMDRNRIDKKYHGHLSATMQ